MRQGLPSEVVATLEAYLDELAHWAARLNLTSIPREQMWSRNVDESLALLETANPAAASNVIDIGSGGGVPGLVIAIVRPDLHVTLLDSDTRKTAFLVHVAGLLALPLVTVESIRAEDAGRRATLRASFDVATSRATAPPHVLCELALPLLKVGGTLCTLVSNAEGLLASCRAAAVACGGAAPEAPTESVLRVRKTAPTPDTYPRRAGTPSRRPIS